MKIRGPSGPNGSSKVTRKSGSGGQGGGQGGSSFSSSVDASSSGVSDAAAPTNSQSIAQIDALLALQGTEDATQGRSKQKMKKRAVNILDALDKIRMKMLTGQMTVGDMIDVADVVASHREQIDDPALMGLMDEVDLRAQVELAKMRVALNQQSSK